MRANLNRPPDAQFLGGELIVLEDHEGKKLALNRQVPRLSTAMLAAEMVAVEAIGEPEGFAVYEAATPASVGKPDWAPALQRARAAVLTTSAALPVAARASRNRRGGKRKKT